MPTWTTPPINPTVTAGLYNANDAIGGLMSTRLPFDQGTLMSITIQDDSDQAPACTMWFYYDEPAGIADADAFEPTDAQQDLGLGAVTCNTWFDAINSKMCVIDNIGLPVRTLSNTLYFQLNTSGTPTFAATDDIHITLGFVY